jgi:deazaflavin-dependent oxidoreductase (nitroreductase family)
MPTRFGNFLIKSIVVSPFHVLLGNSFSVITVTGRKTGKLITTPVNTVTIDNCLSVISLRSRTWWRNLSGGQTAELHRAGKQIPVRGEIIKDPGEIVSNLQKYFIQYPGYARYFQVRTGQDGMPSQEDLKKVAEERVIIRLIPIP